MLDWSTYIPARAPDNQNILKAPQMRSFVRGEAPNALSEHFEKCQTMLGSRLKSSVTVAELSVSHNSTNSVLSNQNVAFNFDDPDGRAQVLAAIETS